MEGQDMGGMDGEEMEYDDEDMDQVGMDGQEDSPGQQIVDINTQQM